MISYDIISYLMRSYDMISYDMISYDIAAAAAAFVYVGDMKLFQENVPGKMTIKK